MIEFEEVPHRLNWKYSLDFVLRVSADVWMDDLWVPRPAIALTSRSLPGQINASLVYILSRGL